MSGAQRATTYFGSHARPRRPQPSVNEYSQPNTSFTYSQEWNPKSSDALAMEKKEFQARAIIEPPHMPEKMSPYRLYRYVIDSRERNLDKYPSPASYEVQLPDDIQDVAYVSLYLVDIPFSRYLIHGGNRYLYVSTSLPVKQASGKYVCPDVVTVELEEGEYTEVTMVTELNTKINAALGAPGLVTVTYNQKKDAFVFECAAVDGSGDPAFFHIMFDGPTVAYGPQSIEKIPVMVNGSIQRDAQGNVIYNYVTVGDQTQTYRPNTPARILGFANKLYRAAVDGTVAGTSGSVTLTGTGTQFTQQLTAGAAIRLVTYDPTTGNPSFTSHTVSAVTSATSLTLAAPLATNVQGGFVYTTQLRAPYRRQFVKDPYLVFKIDGVEHNHSLTPIIDKSFAIIPNSDCCINIDDGESYIKWFDPPVASLKKIKVGFYDYDGGLYDFQNQEHRIELTFALLRTARQFEE